MEVVENGLVGGNGVNGNGANSDGVNGNGVNGDIVIDSTFQNEELFDVGEANGPAKPIITETTGKTENDVVNGVGPDYNIDNNGLPDELSDSEYDELLNDVSDSDSVDGNYESSDTYDSDSSNSIDDGYGNGTNNSSHPEYPFIEFYRDNKTVIRTTTVLIGGALVIGLLIRGIRR